MPDNAAPHPTIVHACTRHGTGGSPTAVLPDTDLDDVTRRAVPVPANRYRTISQPANGLLLDAEPRATTYPAEGPPHA
ncbi:hypothetical protein [Streptomyces sp. NPDC002550]